MKSVLISHACNLDTKSPHFNLSLNDYLNKYYTTHVEILKKKGINYQIKENWINRGTMQLNN